MSTYFAGKAVRLMYTEKEVITFVKDNDVKFIRLAFCDLLGNQKNISILPDALETAFERGIPFDGSSILGFNDVVNSDLFLFPDASTLSILPWRPQQGRVVRFFCNIKNSDGTDFLCDSRKILEKVIARSMKSGIGCKVGSECEFYLFKTDDDGNRTDIPYDRGGYCDVSPLDKGENVRREVCLTLEEMGITPESSHHEHGPGQNEIDFECSNPLRSADNLITFKSVVAVVANRSGLSASFEPKPIPGESGNALHINLSLYKNGKNIFDIEGSNDNARISRAFMAGVINRIKEITVFLNPSKSSYERFGNFGAPKFISWSSQNRSQLIRIPAATGEKKRMELRSPDPLANPYLAYALVLSAGLEGIEKNMEPMEAVNINLYNENPEVNLDRLPLSLEEAKGYAKESEFVRGVLGDTVTEKFIEII